jgi:hypothetical protein
VASRTRWAAIQRALWSPSRVTSSAPILPRASIPQHLPQGVIIDQGGDRVEVLGPAVEDGLHHRLVAGPAEQLRIGDGLVVNFHWRKALSRPDALRG